MTIIYPTRDYSDDFQGNKPDSLDYDLQSEKQRIAEGTEEIKKELFEKWKKQYANAPVFPDTISNVNPELMDFMLSFDLIIFYNDLAKKFGFSQEQRDILPQLVWKTVIGKNWSDLESLVANNLRISPSIANQVIQLTNQKILLKAKELSEKPFIPKKRIASQIPETKILKISLSQALEKYPRLGEQLVTGNPIKLKIFPDPVRPSIKNWIAEYHAVLGASSHGTMERGNFLYHSENARRLSFGERQKLAVILKSLDENEPVAVDVEKQEVIFNLQPTTDNLQQTTSDRNPKSQVPTRLPDGQVSNKIPNPKIQNYFPNEVPMASRDSDRSVGTNNDFHFSSPQRLQSEPPQPKSYQHFNPYHIDPVGYPEDKPKPEPPKPPAPPRGEPKISGNVVDLRN